MLWSYLITVSRAEKEKNEEDFQRRIHHGYTDFLPSSGDCHEIKFHLPSRISSRSTSVSEHFRPFPIRLRHQASTKAPVGIHEDRRLGDVTICK